MYTESQLFAEIGKVIDDTLAQARPAPASWIVQSVISLHPDVHGEDRDFYVLCGREHARYAVRKVLRNLKMEEDDADPSLLLPGFEHLCKRYLVERGGDQVIIPIDQLTSTELEAKAEEYRRMGHGCFKHADELIRYKEAKEQTNLFAA